MKSSHKRTKKTENFKQALYYWLESITLLLGKKNGRTQMDTPTKTLHYNYAALKRKLIVRQL